MCRREEWKEIGWIWHLSKSIACRNNSVQIWPFITFNPCFLFCVVVFISLETIFLGARTYLGRSKMQSEIHLLSYYYRGGTVLSHTAIPTDLRVHNYLLPIWEPEGWTFFGLVHWRVKTSVSKWYSTRRHIELNTNVEWHAMGVLVVCNI
jgi:hypothetical protein